MVLRARGHRAEVVNAEVGYEGSPSKNLANAVGEILIAFKSLTWARRFVAQSLYTVAVQTWRRSAASETVRSGSES